MGKLASAVPFSQNAKLGGMAATYAAQVTCPRSCPLLGAGCYAEGYTSTVGSHTSTLTRAARGAGAGHLRVARAEAREIDKLPGGLPLRLHVVGDCRDEEAVMVLRKAWEAYVERCSR